MKCVRERTPSTTDMNWHRCIFRGYKIDMEENCIQVHYVIIITIFDNEPELNEQQWIWNGILRIPLLTGYETKRVCVLEHCVYVICATVSFELRSKTDCLSKWIGANPFLGYTHNVCTLYVYFFSSGVSAEWESTEKAAIRGASTTQNIRCIWNRMKNEWEEAKKKEHIQQTEPRYGPSHFSRS